MFTAALEKGERKGGKRRSGEKKENGLSLKKNPQGVSNFLLQWNKQKKRKDRNGQREEE